MKGSVWRTALPNSMLKTNTAFPAIKTARIVMDQTQMIVLSVPSVTLSSTVACVFRPVPKGLIMKKRQKIVKVGSCCFLQNGTEIQVNWLKIPTGPESDGYGCQCPEN